MNRTHKHTYHLTAGECDATGSLPLPLLVERLIEVATEHANMLGIGYDRLKLSGISWVLSRMSVEMSRYPAINDTYSITTWIESFNHRFSERNMCITDAQGHIIGYARTVWAAIDFRRRSMADLPQDVSLPVGQYPCPINKMPRMFPISQECAEFEYTFRYCDLDFNRHVNTVCYIELILNRWSLADYDARIISRFDIMFSKECHFMESVNVRTLQTEPVSECELIRGDERVVAARITWAPRVDTQDKQI